ncbi:meiosis initiator protein isoform X2 [Hemitrygon akajei]|uniref:meiosis initiator protein isoform X2 n=1 Tax=Hemitrygon akajei TaxID=2704970 RepID=UPI003BF96B0A
MLLRIMSSLIQVKHEVEDWNFEQNVEIPSRREILTLNYEEHLTPESQKIKLSPLQHRRKQREQYRSNVDSLRELAAILPLPLQKQEKRLTKKEVLNQVLLYIAFLNRHISNAKSLLKNHSVEIDENECCLNRVESTSTEEAVQSNTEEISSPSSSPSFKKMRLRNICSKSRKKKWVEKTGIHNSTKYSSENDEGKTDLSHDSSLYDPPASPPCPSLKNQKLVHYLSSHDEDDEVDQSPWLPQESPQGAAEVHSPVSDSLTTSGLQTSLGLSPSLFSSPGRHIQLLQDGKENLTQALFGMVCLSPEFPVTKPGDSKHSNVCQTQQLPSSYWNAPLKDDPDQTVPETPLITSDSFQSTFIFDHCYLPYSETSKSESSQADSMSSGENSCQICPSSEKWDKRLQQENSNESEHCLSSSDDFENNDITWTPHYRGKLPQPAAPSKLKHNKNINRAKQPRVRRKRCCAFQLKKKCVNGFIMFCRVNRRLYISDHPGTASTVATKALAHVWRTMSKNERQPYCIKAREFSKMNNRIVKLDSSSSEEKEEVEMPEPLHLL